MANRNAVNIRTGGTEVAKAATPGRNDEIWVLQAPATMASGDTITGPSLPVNSYLCGVDVECGVLGASALFTVGYAGAAAAFISSSNVGVAGGKASMNVPGAMGYSPTVATPILITLTGATTAAARIAILASYTLNP